MIEKRRTRFAERLTMWVFTLSALGIAVIILEPELAWKSADGTVLRIGGHAFSDELVGGAVTVAIIGTITALIRFWFPGSEIPPINQPKDTTTTIATTTTSEGVKDAAKP